MKSVVGSTFFPEMKYENEKSGSLQIINYYSLYY